MSREELKKYIPDTPEEISFIGSSIVRLGSAMTGILIFATDPIWICVSAGLTWFGHEVSEYFKVNSKKKSAPDKKEIE